MCENETTVLDAFAADATYLWQDGSTNPTFTVTSSGTYSVEVTSINGCSATDSIEVNFDLLPIVDLGADIALCENETTVLDAFTAGATYLWQDGSNDSTFNVDSPGIYTVQVTVGACTVEDSIEVIYNLLPEVHMFDVLEVCSDIRGDGIFNLFEASPLINTNIDTIEATFYTNFSDAENDIDRIENPSEYISQPTTVYIRLENIETQCFSIGSFQIDTMVCHIFIPEGFSPNGDTINETFDVTNIELFPNRTLEIVNRYGVTVYTGNASVPKWDGRYKGDLLPTGVYYYIINLNNDGAIVKDIQDNYVGWVYLSY